VVRQAGQCLVVCGLLIVVTTGCAAAPAPSGSTAEAGAVVEAFLAARAARDLEATMAAFDEVPELRSSQGINWSGRDAVRAIMAYRLLDTYTLGDRHVVGNTVTWTEHVRRTIASGSPPANFDEDVEAVVVRGRIKSLVTYLGGMRLPPTVTATVPEPAPNPLVLPLSIALLVLAVLIWPRAAAEPRRVPSGALLSGLRRYAEAHAEQSAEERR
jgi:hypothetical protein